MRALAAILLFWAALPALAQVPSPIPWWDRPMRRDLGLSEDQNRRIDSVLRANRTEMLRLRAAVVQAEGELQDVMDAPALDLQRAGEAIERLVAVRSDLTRNLAQMGLKLRQVLTSEQWKDLQKRQPKEWRRRMNRPGPPGMSGPPPPEY